MRYLTLSEVLEVHRPIMAQSGGAEGLMPLPGVESALAQPQMTCCGINGELTKGQKPAELMLRHKELSAYGMLRHVTSCT